MLTFALPTGRSIEDCTDILLAAGLPAASLRKPGRNLVIEEGGFRYLLTKPSDVPTLVSQGAADLALIGNDVTEEASVALTELLDTGKGRCFMAIAGHPSLSRRFDGHESGIMGLKVATKYPHTAEKIFADWGVQIRILHLHGSVELAPVLGLSDCILDIVQTGGTLKANGLEVIKKTFPVSLRLIANAGSMQLRWGELRGVVEAIGGATKKMQAKEA